MYFMLLASENLTGRLSLFGIEKHQNLCLFNGETIM